ncbi:phosphate/phosphite/phosphonate ABC transporter substrate-binding protein [Hoeflea olei]|uniref:Phosphate ABC transporter substrate-binding protein n=1 Tax=Hoeflea olei TaxID=1480615 RepID=A0A1C1Z0Q3_9HYPH|nr:PhnD/SsuA/transferrin family substrate-binding protein [Hoeflea olei]OCW59338.1 hypothetical protein AWJ14_09855 [Hoeflea olei]
MTGLAALPMYDWPEIRPASDALWAAIRDQLLLRGIAAPAVLDRGDQMEALWTDPDLVLSQTCGYPFATRLAGRVALVATPAHAATGARPGRYYSVLVARRTDGPVSAGDLAGRRFAFNMRHSQSGFAAPVRLLLAGGHSSQPKPLETGAHRASIRAVATGEADWAAIDAVTWQLALRHEPAAETLRVFAVSPETPALPLITSLRHAADAPAIADAVEAAIAGLDAAIRKQLLLTGLVRLNPQDYAPLAASFDARRCLPSLPA